MTTYQLLPELTAEGRFAPLTVIESNRATDGMPVEIHDVALANAMWRKAHRRRSASSRSDGRDVYFIRARWSGLVKIGVAASPETRLRQLATSSPEPLDLLGTIRGIGGPGERALHHKFAGTRSHGEWFRPAPELLAYIEESASGASTGSPLTRSPDTSRGTPVRPCCALSVPPLSKAAPRPCSGEGAVAIRLSQKRTASESIYSVRGWGMVRRAQDRSSTPGALHSVPRVSPANIRSPRHLRVVQARAEGQQGGFSMNPGLCIHEKFLPWPGYVNPREVRRCPGCGCRVKAMRSVAHGPYWVRKIWPWPAVTTASR